MTTIATRVAVGTGRAARRSRTIVLADTLALALRGVLANALRAALTALGVVIGTAAVIVTVAIGNGASVQTQQRLESLGVNLLTITSGRGGGGVGTRGVVFFGGGGGESTLTLDDVEGLRAALDPRVVKAVVPESSNTMTLQTPYQSARGQVIGTSPEYLGARGLTVAEGRFLVEGDVAARSGAVVLGATVAETLFPQGGSVGSTVRIGGRSYTVAGVLARQGGGGLASADGRAFVAISTFVRQIRGGRTVDQIYIEAASRERIPEAERAVSLAMLELHRIADPDAADFSVINNTQILDSAEASAQTFTFLLAGIAAVSLLVGGIGVMNIMIVSVTERTREIGLRLAVGARGRDVLLQFLAEAVVLCVGGGLVGVGVGLLASRFMGSVAPTPLIPTPQSAALAAGVSAGVGLIFGLYPAWRASRLDPAEALRYE